MLKLHKYTRNQTIKQALNIIKQNIYKRFIILHKKRQLKNMSKIVKDYK